MAVLSPGTVMKSSGQRPPTENTVSGDTVLFPSVLAPPPPPAGLTRKHPPPGCTMAFSIGAREEGVGNPKKKERGSCSPSNQWSD